MSTSKSNLNGFSKGVTLAEIARISKGKQLNRNGLSSTGDYPVMNGGVSPSGWHSMFNQRGGKIVVSQGGASAGFVTYMATNFWAGAHCYVIEADEGLVLPRFLFHVLKKSERFIQGQKTGAGIPGLNKSVLSSLEIDLPEIPSQREILTKLDTFTALESELEAELRARQKQYDHFSELLLFNFPGESETVKVSDICRIARGRVISKDYLRSNSGIYPVYSSQTINNGIFGLIDTYDFDTESITWTTDGANAGSIFYHNNEKFSLTNVCGLLQPLQPEKLSMKFLAHLLKKVAPNYVKSGMGNPKLMSNVMGAIELAIPDLETQNKVAAILDNFENLISDSKNGIPSELSARRKQYEYYRDQLLTFKEALT